MYKQHTAHKLTTETTLNTYNAILHHYITQQRRESSSVMMALNIAISHCPMRVSSVCKQYVINKIRSSFAVIMLEKLKY